MKPRILIFSLAYYPFVGGAEVAIKEIADRLPAYEFEMITVNLDGKQLPVEQVGQVKVYRLGRGPLTKYWFQFSAYFKARALHRANPYQATWAMMANQGAVAAYFFKLSYPQILELLTLQEGDSTFSIFIRTFYIWPLYRALYARANLVQAISHYLADRARQYGAPKVEIVPNGVDLQLFSAPKPTEVRERTIITTSRLVAKNGVAELIESLRYLPSDITLEILGDGPQEQYLKQLAQRLKIADRIKFLGYVPHQELPPYLQRAGVFVRASRSEGLGSSFLEAMATGIPMVATAVGGIPDFLTAGETGWVCQVKNPKSIADQVVYILDPQHAAEVRRVTTAAETLIISTYNWDLVAAKMDAMFKSLIKHGSQP